MEKLYYHPDRMKMENIPVFTDDYHYQSICYFLSLAEQMEPTLIRDLENILPLYKKTEKQHEQYRENNQNFLDNWAIFEKANQHRNPHLLKLKEALINWAKTYGLTNAKCTNIIYFEIALWSLPSICEHEEEVQKNIEFLQSINHPIHSAPLQWSITDSIYFEDEASDINNKDKMIFNEKSFPFVFTPVFFNIPELTLLPNEPQANDYEQIYVSYHSDVNRALKGETENIQGYSLGHSWDPRNNTWSEFEKGIDEAYKKYKELYRARTESIMKQQGYIEGKEKRSKEHFEWLVRYQIQKWTIKEIADHYSKDRKIYTEDAIKKALISTSKITQIKLRK